MSHELTQTARRIITYQKTTTRDTPGAVPAPSTVSNVRIEYTRNPGAAPRITVVELSRAKSLTNTERFWYERAARPAPTRTRSLPPTISRQHRVVKHKDTLWDELRRHKHSASRLLRQGRDRALAGIARVRRAAPSWRSIAISAGLVYLVANSVAYNRQPKPFYLEQYSAAPTWLYADSADQILGLHEPLFPRAVQPRPVIDKLFRQANKKWATDKAYLHKDADGNYPNQEQMKKIFLRYRTAKEEYHKRPPYQQNWAAYKKPMNMTIPGDDLPHFQPGCVCNMTLAVSNQISHALTPFWAHDGPPKTPDELSTYCPCSLSSAAWRLKQGFSSSFLPPQLPMFYNQDEELALRWDPGSWYLWRWGKGREVSSWTAEEKKQLQKEGWVVKHEPKSAVREKHWMDEDENEAFAGKSSDDGLGQYEDEQRGEDWAWGW